MPNPSDIESSILRRCLVRAKEIFDKFDLSDSERFVLEFGTEGMSFFVHQACWKPFLENTRNGGPIFCHQGGSKIQFDVEIAVPQIDRTVEWNPEELRAKNPSITHCDHCDIKFSEREPMIVNFWLTTPAELALWERAHGWPGGRHPRTAGATLLAVAWGLALIHQFLIPHFLMFFVPLMAALGVAYLAFGSKANDWLKSLGRFIIRSWEGPENKRVLYTCLILGLGYFLFTLWMFHSLGVRKR